MSLQQVNRISPLGSHVNLSGESSSANQHTHRAAAEVETVEQAEVVGPDVKLPELRVESIHPDLGY